MIGALVSYFEIFSALGVMLFLTKWRTKRELRSYQKVYIYSKSSFPKHVKRHSEIWPCNVNVKFDYYVLVKSFSHVNK